MASKKKGQVDSSKFEGNGISFRAKLIGTEEVPEARGDTLCQEVITRLKNVVRSSGQHKKKIFVNVTLEGLKIFDAMSLTANQNKKKSDTRNSKLSVDSEEADKSDDMLVIHTHPVHHISFISRDTTDNRAFGYIIGTGDGKHTFFAIKTAAAAEMLVLTLRDLFQVVYEMKKKQVDEAKDKLDNNTTEGTQAENSNPSGEGSSSEVSLSQTQIQTVPTADGDGIYHVPPNNAPVNGSIEEQQANLLDLEDQADTILKGIEQIKNLEFDSITSEGDKPLSSHMSPVSQPKGSADPWAAPASAATSTGNSSLGDLAGIQTGPFVNVAHQQAFPGGPFPGQAAGYNVSAVPGYNMTNAGLPLSRDPFGSDPFTANYQQQGMRPAGMVAPGFGAAPNPFAGGPFGQPFPGGMARPPMAAPTSPVGMFPPRPAAPGNPNPFANGQDDPNLLKPIRNDQQEVKQEPEMAKAPKADLFGDLVGMKISTSAALTPKDMFKQLTAADKKSMNQMKNVNEDPTKGGFGDAFAP